MVIAKSVKEVMPSSKSNADLAARVVLLQSEVENLIKHEKLYIDKIIKYSVKFKI